MKKKLDIRGLIGVVHLPAMPGDPLCEKNFQEVEDFALSDAKALKKGGIQRVIVENFGSTPFYKGTKDNPLPTHQLAFMTRVLKKIQDECDLILGVNCLRNDANAALGIAAALDLAFFRVNVHVGAYICDQGLIEGDAARTLRYRSSLGADTIAILADVLVKHASPLGALDPKAATKDTIYRGLADAVIVSGEATGEEVSVERLRTISEAAGNHSVLVGSGFNMNNAPKLAPFCDGAIVGTALKVDGKVSAPVDVDRVRDLVEKSEGLFRRSKKL